MISFTSGAISGTVSLGPLGSAPRRGSLSCEGGGSKGWGWDGAGLWRQSRRWAGMARSPLTAPLPALQVAAVLTLPFDVVKTQRQIELGDSEVHPGEGLGCGRVPGGAAGTPRWYLGIPGPSPAPLSPQSQPPSLPPPGCSCDASVPSLAPGGCLQVRPCPPTPGWGTGVLWCHRGANGAVLAGFLPRVIKVAPACAIMISTYEFGKTFFQKLNQERRLRGL